MPLMSMDSTDATWYAGRSVTYRHQADCCMPDLKLPSCVLKARHTDMKQSMVIVLGPFIQEATDYELNHHHHTKVKLRLLHRLLGPLDKHTRRSL